MARINYSKLVPADSFIGRYLEFMQHQESPAAYDFWAAIWLMSLALGRGTIVPRPRAPIYMNWYVLLVAESGVTRKSSEVRVATSIARNFIAKSRHRYELIETKTTPEALEQRLQQASTEHGYAYAAISISELVTFLGRERYTMQMPGLLTDLYDCPELRCGGGTLARGPATVSNVFVSFLSASTPTWLRGSINPDVIEGGFTSRCIFVVAEDRKKRIAWPTEAEAVTHVTVLDELERMAAQAERNKQVALSETGMSKYVSWYNTRQESDDPFRKTFESREDSHVLRMAAFLAVNDGAWLIDGGHITKAIRIINEVKFDGSTIFASGGATERVVLGVEKLRNALITKGIAGGTQTELYFMVRSHLTAEQFKTTLALLHELDMVQQFVESNGPGRKAKIWRATTVIQSRAAIETLLRRIQS